MAGGNIRAGGAFVEIFGKDMLDKSLKAASVKLKAFGSSVATIGAGMTAGAAAVGAPIAAMVKTFADVGDAAAKAATRTGMTSNAISELGYAAGQSGSDLAGIENGVRKMQKTLTDAATGSKTAQEALARLGLTASDLAGMTPDQQFELMADRMAGITDPAVKAATAMEIFGKSGVNLLPLMSAGAEGIRALREEARQVGASIDPQDAANAEILGDAWARVKTTLMGASIQVGASLAPMLIRLFDAVLNVTKAGVEWLKRNRELLASIGQGIALFAAAGAGIAAMGVAITGVGAILGSVPAMVAVAGAAFLGLSKTGNQLASNLLDVFRGLGHRVADTFGIIRDLVMAGDIEQATKVLWAGIKEAFAEGKLAVMEVWVGMQESMLGTWNDWIYDTGSVLTKAWAGWRGIFNEIRGLVDDSFDVDAANSKIVEDTHKTLEMLEQDRRRSNDARRQQLLTDLKAAQDEAKAARDAAKAAIDESRQKLDDLTISGGTEIELPDIDTTLADLSQKNKRASEGTFLAGAVSRLGGAQNIESKQLGVAEEQLEETKRLRKTIEENPLAFV